MDAHLRSTTATHDSTGFVAATRCFRSRLRTCTAVATLLVAVALARPVAASVEPDAALSIANADFSSAGNVGSIGGGVVGGSGSAPIGSGPWSGAYAGVAGLLAPPTVSIAGGEAHISGLLGIDALGIVNNNGRLFQDTGIPWVANRRYTLSADIDAGGVLNAALLTNGSVGIAMATDSSPTSRLASSLAGTGVLSVLGGNTYRLSIEYVTGSSVSGNINAHLFAEPSGVLTANLLSSVDFDNVVLSTHLLTQNPSSLIAANPGPYSAEVAQQVNPAIGVTVLDALGDPIPGVSVSFSVPSSGASAVIVPNPAVTDANGIAQVVTTANTVAGNYQIMATVGGVASPLIFNLSNLAGPAATLGNGSGSGQSAVAGMPFSLPFGLQVTDAFGNPVAGIAVTFTPPASGASSSFDPNPAISDANGTVQSTATANTIAGTYNVSATVSGVPNPLIFELTNAAGPAAGIGSLSGSGQGAVTGTSFAAPLGLQVLDQYGNAVSGSTVTFAAPGSGPSALLGTAIVVSGTDGSVSTSATANAVAGQYGVTASIAGLGTVGTFVLTNMLDPSIVPDGVGETTQNAAIVTPFSCALLVQVVDAVGNPMPGLAVNFVAPNSGPSALLSNGVVSGTSLNITSDSDGFAWVDATANGIEGSYTVGAQLLFSLAPAAEFRLRNLGTNDPILANGFDGACLPFVGTLELPK